MPSAEPFLVFQIEPHPSPGRPTGLPGKTPANYQMTQVGCFFADSGESACKMAARSQNSLGYFVAVEATFPELDFATDGKQTLPPYLEEKAPAAPPAAGGEQE
ncbi:MAG TPA: hypothetical protein VNZ01_08910 [Solirubrobacteraceae bacterium]|jgi:hypothetical protein|nr:hypothetical protein [Solirubrobacteraceae bacterium]